MPRLPKKVKALLNKSRNSAIIAVESYNKPSINFRSYAYIVLMIIAWTSLFHAIFEKRGVKYYYREKNSIRYVRIKGEKKSWDLSKCINEYFGETASPVRDNLKFFIELRNKIEHSFLPAIDIFIQGESQALLLNYEKLLTGEFGHKYGLNDSLAIPLQLISVNPDWRKKTFKELQSREYKVIKEFIDTYRFSLDDGVWETTEYSFRVFLIPKIGNKEKSSDISVEFVQYNSGTPEEMREYKKMMGFIKQKRVPVVNIGRFKPGDIARKISTVININFNASTHHARCWRYYKVRPASTSTNPENTNSKFCQYDEVHGDYVYTQDWLDFLIAEMSNPIKRKKVTGLD